MDRKLAILAVIAALILSACSKKEEPVPAAAPAAMSAPAPQFEDRALLPKKSKKRRSVQVGDEIFDQMTQASIAFTAPDKAKYGEEFTIRALIQLEVSKEEVKQALRASGVTVASDIEITRIAEVNLYAPGYTVQARAPERQAVSAAAPTEWLWDLTPTKTGPTEIHLSVTAVVKVDGEKTERLIKTYDHKIKVKVNPKVQAIELLTKYWQWIFTTLLAPAGLWIWKRWKKKPRTTRSPKSVD